MHYFLRIQQYMRTTLEYVHISAYIPFELIYIARTMKKHILATRVGRYVNNSVHVLTRGLGISISEYLRKLILQDLESRHLFEEALAKSIDESSPTLTSKEVG